MSIKDSNTERSNFYVLLLLICLFILAVASSLVYVIFPRERWSGNAGVLIGLWASALGLIALVFARRRIGEWQRRIDSLQLFYEVQLDKEVLARAEYEQSLQATMYQSISERYRNDIEALRGELRSLKQNLETLTGSALKDSINSLIVASKRLELTAAEGGEPPSYISSHISGAAEVKSNRAPAESKPVRQVSDITSETQTVSKASESMDSRLFGHDMSDLLKKSSTGRIPFSEPFPVQGEAMRTEVASPNISNLSSKRNDSVGQTPEKTSPTRSNNFIDDSQRQFNNIAERNSPVSGKLSTPSQSGQISNPIPGAATPKPQNSMDGISEAEKNSSAEVTYNRFGADLSLRTVTESPSGSFIRQEGSSVRFQRRADTPNSQPGESQRDTLSGDIAAQNSIFPSSNDSIKSPLSEDIQPKAGRRRRDENSPEVENLISGRFSRVLPGQHRHGVASESTSTATTNFRERNNPASSRHTQMGQKISGDMFPPVTYSLKETKETKETDAFAPPVEKDTGDEPAVSSDLREKSYSTYLPSSSEIEQRKNRRGTGKNIADILAQRPASSTSPRGHRHRDG